MTTLVRYEPEIETLLQDTRAKLGGSDRWTALRVLDGAPDARASVADRPEGAAILAARDELDRRLRDEHGIDLPLALAVARFAEARALAARAVAPGAAPHRLGDRFDRIATHRIGGPLILFGVMWLVFLLVTDVSAPYVDWLDTTVSGVFGPWLSGLLGVLGLGGGWLEALVVDGVLGGVGGMLAFVPVIAVLYLVLGLLEDSGYFARAAYLADRAMQPLGLPGKSVLPLVVGFGCNVPALLAVRVMERPQDRLTTALLVPFVSCSARLPVFVLLAGALFPGLEGTVVLALYLTSIAAVFGVGLLLRHTLNRRGERAPFVLELPPYRRPSLRTVWTQVRQRTGSFVRKAGTIILGASVLVWLLLATPVRGEAEFGHPELADSAFGVAAESVSGVFAPAGFAAPELSGALAAGFVAKEIVVTTIYQTVGTETDDEAPTAPPGVLEGLGAIGGGFLTATGDALLAVPGAVGIQLAPAGDDQVDSGTAAALRTVFTESSGGHAQAAAAAFLTFVLLYVPCVATVATFGREFGWRWAGVSVALSLAVAWCAAVLVFQLGALLSGIGA